MSNILPNASIIMLRRPERRHGRLFYPAGMQLRFAAICHARGMTIAQLAAKPVMTGDILTVAA